VFYFCTIHWCKREEYFHGASKASFHFLIFYFFCARFYTSLALLSFYLFTKDYIIQKKKWKVGEAYKEVEK